MQTVFGRVDARPALIVRIVDRDGAEGWGEIWCNFPQVGAEYRARLAALVAPRALAGLDPGRPEVAFPTLRARLHRLALQAGEPGPADQIAAGLDIALHDLAARRRGVPLATYLGGEPKALPAYASGIDSRLATEMMSAARDAGYRAFKLRVGFGRQSALDAIVAAGRVMGAGDRLMVDANQSWDVAEAVEMVAALSDAPLDWIEEPLPVDRPVSEWRAVRAASRRPIAGGENMRSGEAFDAAIAGDVFGVIQPDVAKWGGLSLCVPLARRIVAAGKRYCPHYLGGGVGLAVSAHLLAAVGGDGMLEIDVNDNALRDRLCGPLLPLVDNKAVVPAGPGLGFVPDMKAVSDLRVHHERVRVVDA
jgi:L-alanine-DL-glutamate epimerase-like enolase superfamily enzyme